MIEKIREIDERYQHLEYALSSPETMADSALYARLMKEYSALSPVVALFREFEDTKKRSSDAESILQHERDDDMRALANEEICTCRERMIQLEEQIRIMLLPKDPNDDKNVIIEIRAGAGGEEAALFAGVLYRMYTMYAEKNGFSCELASMNETELGGFRGITFMICGTGAYSLFKYESGVHRVQRVPETESSGRIHTSTATVAVLAEAEEVQIEINPADLQIDTIKSTGAGGQHINKTESAIRLIHKPSGVVVECQDERSQLRNKEKAMRLLRSILLDRKQREQKDSIDAARRTQVGSGDRSERIRTYNYPQGRVTDHRIGLTLHRLDSILNGDLDEIIDALITTDQSEKLKNE